MIGHNLGVTTCIMSILKDNDILLQRLHEADPKLKIFSSNFQQNTIKYYIDHIKRSIYRQSQSLKFLTCVCVSKGSGIAANQEMIHKEVFS